MFNKPVLNSDKNGQEIGKVDEIFGPSSSYYFSVNPIEGYKLDAFEKGDKIYIDEAFIISLEYIENAENPKPKISKPKIGLGGPKFGQRGQGRGGQRGGFRGGQGGQGGQRGGFRGRNNNRGR